MATDGSDHNRTVTYVALRPRVNPPPSQVGAWVQRETPVPLPPIPILRSNGPPREILSRVGSQAQKGPRAPIRDGDDGGDDDEDDGNNNYVGVNTIELRSGSLKRRNSSCHGSHDRKRLVRLLVTVTLGEKKWPMLITCQLGSACPSST